MIRYPELINATLMELGIWLGLNPWLVQFVFWFVALSATLRLALFLVAPMSWALSSLSWVIGILATWLRLPLTRRTEPRCV